MGSLSNDTGDKLLRACRTTLGDDLRSLTYFSKEEFDHLYLRDDLERGTDTSAFVENEREGFSSHRTYEWSELGEYEYTLRVFNEGYVVRVIMGDHGVYATVDALTMDRYNEAAQAMEAVLEDARTD